MPEPDRIFIEAISARLYEVRDSEKAGPMQAYIKSTIPLLGVQKPELMNAINPIFTSHLLPDAETWRATVLTLFRESKYREEWHAALELLGCKLYRSWLRPDAVPLCEILIVEGAWWDIVDNVATRQLGHILSIARKEVAPTMWNWATSENRWKRRTSILVQLKHKHETDLELLSYAITQSLDDEDFFLRKSIGWALRQYARTDPNWVVGFVETNIKRLSKLSRREALRNLWKEGRALQLR